MEIDKNLVGKRINSIRKENGLSMEKFGSLIDGASKGLVNNWEKGVNLPNNKRIKLIATLGRISVNELLYGSLDNFRHSVINELFELKFIQSGMKDAKPELYHYLGGEDFKKQIYDRFEKQELGYEDEEKMHEVFRNAYNSKLFGYANRKTEIAYQLDQARRELDLNLILEYFDREANYQEYQRKRNAGEFISPNFEENEKPINIHLDGTKLSNDEVKMVQEVLEKIRTRRNSK
ncbi:helix-turn-helix transcriptional regulator [uncultured Trichococcus sp.]|uniref:helix-turn-helix domain-containing protein n=1 Tax=uncultured Trichococcus sp. TaxID=189665 RepID=UPI0029C8B8A7|nr:helix-turn-helix transcriptional regulator [uncultured Trichococcus sp.]